MTGATEYRVVLGSALRTGTTVATTSGTTATVQPSPGVSDYTVFAMMTDGTAKILPVRVTIIK